MSLITHMTHNTHQTHPTKGGIENTLVYWLAVEFEGGFRENLFKKRMEEKRKMQPISVPKKLTDTDRN